MTDIPEDERSGGQNGRETWSKLAIKLGFSVQALKNWRGREGAPKGPDLAAWEKFIDEQELGVAGNRVGVGREELLKANLVKKNRLLDLEIAEKERKSVDRELVNQMLLRASAMLKTVAFQRLEHEMPAKAVAMGAPLDAMRTLGREAAESLCDVFAQEMDKWGGS